MLNQKISVTERDYVKQPFTEKELKELIGDRDISLFLNTRNEVVKKLNWKNHPPTKEKFIKQVLKEPNVIKRPIFQKGNKLILGFDEKEVKGLV